MTAPIKDGGPAFPLFAPGDANAAEECNRGMSLRAYLAGQAIIGIIAYGQPHDEAANDAVEIADALIKRLEQP